MTHPAVLHLTPFYLFPDHRSLWNPRFDPLGGMQLLTHSLTTALGREGLQQTVVTMGLPGVPRNVQAGPNVAVKCRRFPVLPIPSKLEGYLGLVQAYATAAVAWVLKHRSRLRAQIGIVHVHCDGSGIVPWAGRTAARILDVPLVMQIYSCRTLTQQPTTPLEHLADPWAKRSEVKTMRDARKILTLTQKVKDRMVTELSLPASKIERLAYLTHFDFTSNNTVERRQSLAQQFNIRTDQPIIAYLGRVAAEKGVKYFVEMARILRAERPCRFLIVGDGPELPSIRRLIATLGLESDFVCTGFLPPDWIASVVSYASVGVVPSHYEELGLVILEFMLMDVPVVVHAVGGVEDLVIDGETGLLVPPFQPVQLAAAVRRILSVPELAQRLRAGGRAVPNERFSLAAAARQMRRIYGEIAAAKP